MNTSLTIDPNLPRRKFIKSFTLVGASSLLLGKAWRADVLAEIQPVADPNTAIFRLKVSEYPALGMDFGSVRISTSSVAGTRSTSIFPVIMINRARANQFHVLDAACTHEGCILPIFNAATRRVQCLCHGSQFGIDGRLLRGPAGQPLFNYNSSFDGKDTLTLEVPDRGFSVTSSRVQTTPGWVELQFLGFLGIQYEVHSRASLTDPWRATPFALTSDGPADQMVFKGQDDFAKLYVPTTEAIAFLSVAMRLRQV
ncbi:MAG: Rieske 2Fe-2S domain-containing protein [Verrucomicrobiales bacterium]|nr:Rieske 2Fe-2S domain-containing protein [Verrucomicrobiales bacterium]